MKKFTSINSPVSITALGFGRNMRTYPRRMEFQGVTYDFIDAGLRATLGSGKHATSIFTMTDGACDFRLKSDGRSWTLLGMAR